MSHSALVNIRVRSTLRASRPLRGTSSVKNVILSFLITNVVVVVVVFFFLAILVAVAV